MAGGRLAATGRLSDMLAFEIRGWELVIADLRPEVLARIAGQLHKTTGFPPGVTRSSCLYNRRPSGSGGSSAAGAKLVSLNPIRDTLEDFFVRRVAEVGKGRARERQAPMRAISWIAVNVFKESVRDRSLQPRALRGAHDRVVVPDRSADRRQDVKIIKDLGLAAIAVFGLFIAIFIGIGLVSKEVERRSIYSLLEADRPTAVHRRQLRAGADAGGERRGDDGRALRGARLSRLHPARRPGRGTRPAWTRGCSRPSA